MGSPRDPWSGRRHVAAADSFRTTTGLRDFVKLSRSKTGETGTGAADPKTRHRLRSAPKLQRKESAKKQEGAGRSQCFRVLQANSRRLFVDQHRPAGAKEQALEVLAVREALEALQSLKALEARRPRDLGAARRS